MPLARPTYTYLGKEVENISTACSFGNHQHCVTARESLLASDVDFRGRPPCDCLCHTILACPICGDRVQMEMALLADHMVEQHGGLPITTWGDHSHELFRIYMNIPPTAEELGDWDEKVRRGLKYNVTTLDWFRFLHEGDYCKAVCRMCSWEAALGIQETPLTYCESHLIQSHRWTQEVPGGSRVGPVTEYYIVAPSEIDTGREPVWPFDQDESPSLEELHAGLAVVKLMQRKQDDWCLFGETELAPFVREGTTKAVVQMLLAKGWICEIRPGELRARRPLAVACLKAGLSTHRQCE